MKFVQSFIPLTFPQLQKEPSEYTQDLLVEIFDISFAWVWPQGSETWKWCSAQLLASRPDVARKALDDGQAHTAISGTFLFGTFHQRPYRLSTYPYTSLWILVLSGSGLLTSLFGNLNFLFPLLVAIFWQSLAHRYVRRRGVKYPLWFLSAWTHFLDVESCFKQFAKIEFLAANFPCVIVQNKNSKDFPALPALYFRE